jgi:hypothetical protein
MNHKTGCSRGLRRAGALTVVAAVAMLAAACGSAASSSTASTSADSAIYRQDLAFVQCLRSHGFPKTPSPSPGGHYVFVVPRGPLTGPRAGPYEACKHLLPAASLEYSNP